MNLSQPILIFAGVALAAGLASAHPIPQHKLPKTDNLVVGNCDGESVVEVKNKKAGEKLTDAEARKVTRELMGQWQKRNPGKTWVLASAQDSESQRAGQGQGQTANANPAANPANKKVEASKSLERPTTKSSTQRTNEEVGPSLKREPASDAVTAAAQAQKAGGEIKNQQGIYTDFTDHDKRIWDLETAKLVTSGKEIFHSADRLKSKTAISCDMCHPDAANTHPETYPKYQVQLQRMAALRDMINWCIENPVKGVMLKDDDPNMRALEAYITWQRKGTPLDPGKH